MPESLQLPSAVQIRRELQNLILRDLLGPAGILSKSSPAYSTRLIRRLMNPPSTSRRLPPLIELKKKILNSMDHEGNRKE